MSTELVLLYYKAFKQSYVELPFIANDASDIVCARAFVSACNNCPLYVNDICKLENTNYEYYKYCLELAIQEKPEEFL